MAAHRTSVPRAAAGRTGSCNGTPQAIFRVVYLRLSPTYATELTRQFEVIFRKQASYAETWTDIGERISLC
jgi:hypothetical protein